MNAGEPKSDEIRALDQLVRDTLIFRKAEGIRKLFDFACRIPNYSPFNCLLIYTQKPEATMVLPADKWRVLGRNLKDDARPIAILAPMHPVMFVYDESDTEGDPLPRGLEQGNLWANAFGAHGAVPDGGWKHLEKNCTRHSITLSFNEVKVARAGGIRRTEADRFQLRLNQDHKRNQHFATLAHELGHLFCGHLGPTWWSWWDWRQELKLSAEEFEAEAIAYLVCRRAGLEIESKAYLADYLRWEGKVPNYSLNAILVSAGKVEEWCRRAVKPKARPIL